MDNKTIIQFDDEKLNYKRTGKSILDKGNFIFIILVTFIILLCSVIFCVLIGFDWEPLLVLKKFKRIKKNMNSWESIVRNKTFIEANNGRLLYLAKPLVSNFTCLDYGSYYLPGRINIDSYLPEFVRRGNSGPWTVNKADKNDEPAKQFCSYILEKYSRNNQNQNLITCGIDMFNKIGTSGYFIANSPCERALEVFRNL